jgi:GAF domain-containing protein
MNDRQELLQSIADVARAIFGARAASIMLYDEEALALEFAAVSGEGSDTLVGRRIPATTGVAGWVLATEQPLAIEDVSADPRFAADVASSTGYVPRGLMAAPLLTDRGALGVLNVLDRPKRTEFSLIEMDLLQAFAHQAALSLTLIAPPDASGLDRLKQALDGLDASRRVVAQQLIDALEQVLRWR